MEPVLSVPPIDPATATSAELLVLVQRLLAEAQHRDIERQHQTVAMAARDAELRAKAAELHAKDLKIKALTLELAHLRRIRFGVKSETFPTAQRDLFRDSWNEDLAAVEAAVEALAEPPATTLARPKRPRAGRQALPDHLPRIEHRHEPDSCQCGDCGANLTLIGEDPSASSGQASPNS